MLYFSKWLLWFVKKWNKVCVKKENRKLHQTHDNPVFNKKGQMCCLDFKFKKKIDWNELSIFSQQNKKSLNTLQMITQWSYHVAILSADQYRRFIGKTFVLLGQHKVASGERRAKRLPVGQPEFRKLSLLFMRWPTITECLLCPKTLSNCWVGCSSHSK